MELKKEYIKHISDYCKTNIHNPKCMYIIGYMHYLEGNYDEALKIYRKCVIILKPDITSIIYTNNVNSLDYVLDNLSDNVNMETIMNILKTKKNIKYISGYIELNSSISVRLCVDGYMCYLDGDYTKAVELYKKAINLGNSVAMSNLALMYIFGNGVEINNEEAIKLYKKSIELGNINSIRQLGMFYESKRNYIEVIKMFRKYGSVNEKNLKLMGFM